MILHIIFKIFYLPPLPWSVFKLLHGASYLLGAFGVIIATFTYTKTQRRNNLADTISIKKYTMEVSRSFLNQISELKIIQQDINLDLEHFEKSNNFKRPFNNKIYTILVEKKISLSLEHGLFYYFEYLDNVISSIYYQLVDEAMIEELMKNTIFDIINENYEFFIFLQDSGRLTFLAKIYKQWQMKQIS
ncbi:hypothetical protein [Convivina intestini]|uniref:DUF4760 domain-containing protein n=1 Tax=Convivina intestini TaxID=1505726 RepID=A0A2U1DFB8_9LACO|nr:hypothetical protein [Convivina intestini]PVY86242.1 hypothetical protein C7384_101157 [Convivina intestini]CAH1851258.1 hypothetical protein R077811_00256 [Convivina intestini]SDB81794.1 hypothetical protein SAMN05216341_101149 [Leuconostocaceae bacterium R-53105]